MLLQEFVENIRNLTIGKVQRNPTYYNLVGFYGKHKATVLKELAQLCNHFQFVWCKRQFVGEHQLLTCTMGGLQMLHKIFVQDTLVRPVDIDDDKPSFQSSYEVFLCQSNNFLTLASCRFGFKERTHDSFRG